MTDKTEGLEVVAYLAWRDGKPCYEGDDAVCEAAVWPVDRDDDRASMPVVTLASAQAAVAAERSRIIAANAPEIERVNKHLTALETLIKKVHTAKGRYHTQLAMCDLYDAVGLANERPKK